MGRSIAGSTRRCETLNQLFLLVLFQFKLLSGGIGKAGVDSWGMKGQDMAAAWWVKAHSHPRHLGPSLGTGVHHNQQPLLHLLASTGSLSWQVAELSYLSQGAHKAQKPLFFLWLTTWPNSSCHSPLCSSWEAKRPACVCKPAKWKVGQDWPTPVSGRWLPQW